MKAFHRSVGSKRASLGALLQALSLQVFRILPLLFAGTSLPAQGQAQPSVQRVDVTGGLDEGSPLLFKADVAGADVQGLTFSWDFGDGRTASGTGMNLVRHSYRDDGTYTVSVAVADAGGGSDVRSRQVDIRNVAPEIRRLIGSMTLSTGEEGTFRTSVWDPGADDLTYTWDFGDGSEPRRGARLHTVHHTYDRQGVFTVTLRAEDGDGGVASQTLVVSVEATFTASVAGDVRADLSGGSALSYVGYRHRNGKLDEDGELACAAQIVLFDDVHRAVLAIQWQADSHPLLGRTHPITLGSGTPGVAFWYGLPDDLYRGLIATSGGQFDLLTDPLGAGRNLLGALLGEAAPAGADRHRERPLPPAPSFFHNRFPNVVFAAQEGTLQLSELDEGRFTGIIRFQADVANGEAARLSRVDVSGQFLVDVNALSLGMMACEDVPNDESFAVVGHVPEDGEQNVDYIHPDVRVTFSRPVDAGSASMLNLSLEYPTPGGGFGFVPLRYEQVDARTLRLIPDVDSLKDGVTYRVAVLEGAAGVRGRAGEKLAAPYTFQFSTIVSPDSIGLYVYQVARDAPLVLEKPTLTRVYTYWTPHDDVDPSAQVEQFEALVSIVDGRGRPVYSNANQRARIERPDRYSKEERRRAENSVNFFNWRPASEEVSSLRAIVEPTKQRRSEPHRFESVPKDLAYWEVTEPPRLTFDYYYLRIGRWAAGVPEDDQVYARRIARDAETYATQNFPVLSTSGRERGEVTLLLDNLERRGANLLYRVYGRVEQVERFAEWIGKLEGGTLTALIRAFHDRVAPHTSATFIVGFLPSSYTFGGEAFFDFSHNPGQEELVREGFARRTIIHGVEAGDVRHAYASNSLTHEFGHTLSLPHLPGVNADGREALRAAKSLPIHPQGMHLEGFRMAPSGRFGWSKSVTEGNAQATHLRPLMYPIAQSQYVAFITNGHYERVQREIATALERHNFSLNGRHERRAGRGEKRLMLAGALPARGPSPSRPLRAARPAAREPAWLQVSGFVSPGGDGAVLWPPQVFEPHRPPRTAAGPYAVALLDAAGAELAAALFDVEEPSGADEPAAWRYFSAALPYDQAAAHLVVRHDGRELGRRSRTPHPPEVRLIDPAPGASWSGRRTVRWESADADGDPVFYTLYYSPTGAFPWSALAVDVAAAALDVDTGALAPGPDPTLRLIATDGFNQAEARVSFALRNDLAVRTTAPAPNDTTELMLDVTATFGTDLDLGQVDTLTFRLKDRYGRAVPAHVAYDTATRTALLTPKEPLWPRMAYTAVLAAGLADRYGNRLPREHTWTFHTGARP